MAGFEKNLQYYKFSLYGFLKNLRFFDAFFILFLLEKGLPYTQIGILYAFREITINVLEIPSGFVADTWGRKKSLLGSFLAYCLSFVLFSLSGNFAGLLAAFVLFGVGDAFRTGTHKAMIMDYLKLKGWENSKIAYYGHTRSWSQLGSALSALIAGLLVFFSGNYTHIFLFSLLPYLLNFVLIWSYPQELNYSSQLKSRGRLRLGETLRSFWTTIRFRNVIAIINTTSLHSAYLKAVKDYIQVLMLNLVMLLPFLPGAEIEKKNGLFIGLFYFLIYLLTSRASAWSSYLPAENKRKIAFVTLLAGFVLGSFSGAFSLGGGRVFALLAFVGIFLIENIRKPILTGFIADEVPNTILASVISAQSLVQTFMTAFIALFFGFLADQFDVGLAMVVLSVLLLLVSIAVNALFRRRFEARS